MFAVVELMAVFGLVAVLGLLFVKFVLPAHVRAQERVDANEYRRAVEAEVAERLAQERFESDVQRRLHEARDEGSIPFDAEQGE